MRKLIKQINISPPIIDPCPIILIADCTFFKRNDGLCIFYAFNLKKVIAYSHIKSEKKIEYFELKMKIESLGFKIQAVVIDGRIGIKSVFKNIPIQMCQFHQLSIIRRYLTNNPRLEASKELKSICRFLPSITKNEFELLFNNWKEKWSDFLKEKTYTLDGKWHFTHHRLRAARKSLESNISYLFTYQDYSEINIPNTTNAIESLNSKIKELTKIHRGYSLDLKYKIIAEILWN